MRGKNASYAHPWCGIVWDSGHISHKHVVLSYPLKPLCYGCVPSRGAVDQLCHFTVTWLMPLSRCFIVYDINGLPNLAAEAFSSNNGIIKCG